MMVRRYTGFIDQQNSEADHGSSGSEMPAEGYGPDYCISSVGRRRRGERPVGYGPGGTSITVPNNHGVETRLDAIINRMDTIIQRTGNVGNGPGPATTAATPKPGVDNSKQQPTAIIFNENAPKQYLGEKDAAHEYLRTQHRRIAAVNHP